MCATIVGFHALTRGDTMLLAILIVISLIVLLYGFYVDNPYIIAFGFACVAYLGGYPHD